MIHKCPHLRCVTKIMEVVETFRSGIEQMFKIFAFLFPSLPLPLPPPPLFLLLHFFFFFLKNSVCVKGGQGSECSAEHCYLPKTFWSGMCCILKYTQVTSQGKVTFNPLLALCANAIT